MLPSRRKTDSTRPINSAPKRLEQPLFYEEEVSPLMRLPDEILLEIFQRLDFLALVSLEQVCRRSRHLAHDPIVWERFYANFQSGRVTVFPESPWIGVPCSPITSTRNARSALREVWVTSCSFLHEKKGLFAKKAGLRKAACIGEYVPKSNSIDISGDSRYLALAGPNRGTLRLWDLFDVSKPLHLMTISMPNFRMGHTFSPSGKYIALWESKMINIHSINWPGGTQELVRSIQDTVSPVYQALFMSEASLLCASGRKVRKIDLTTGLWQQDFERNQADVRLLAISPVDGNIFCSASRAGVVRMFDSRAGSQPIWTNTTGSNVRLNSLTFSANGIGICKTLSGGFTIVDGRTGTELLNMESLWGRFSCGTFSHGGTRYYAATSGGNLLQFTFPSKLSDSQGETENRKTIRTGSIAALLCSPDDRFLCGGGDDFQCTIWRTT